MVARRRLIWVAVIAAIALLAAGFYVQRERARRAENEAGLAASRVLSAVFTTTSALRVAQLSGDVVSEAPGTSAFGMIRNSQTTRAPYSVDYFVDLRNLTPSAYRWNAKDRIMSIDIPEVTVARPNIDMSRARYSQSGLYISRASGIAMQRLASQRLAGAAGEKAKTPENLAKARESARAAVSRFVEAPLTAAGMSNVTVVVRLPGDPRPAGVSAEQWDVSRSISEVLADSE